MIGKNTVAKKNIEVIGDFYGVSYDDKTFKNISDILEIHGEIVDKGMAPEVSITYFVPDLLKEGGSYQTITDVIKRVDNVSRKLVLERKTGISGTNATINISDILEIHGEMVDALQ